MDDVARQGRGRRPYRMAARAAATEATAQAVVAAARSLFGERPYDDVTLPAIAEHAGVTVQTVLRRFGSKEQLFVAAAGARSAEIRADREAAPAGDITHLAGHYERWGEQQQHLLGQEARVPVVRTVTDAGRRYHRDWVAAAFGEALAPLPPDERRRRLAQLTAVTDLGTWRLLRHELGLSRDDAETAVRELVEACLPGVG